MMPTDDKPILEKCPRCPNLTWANNLMCSACRQKQAGMFKMQENAVVIHGVERADPPQKPKMRRGFRGGPNR